MSIDTHQQFLYREILREAHLLPSEQQTELMEELLRILSQNINPPPKHDVMEFRGIAKDFWKGIDVEQYIRELRGPYPDEMEMPFKEQAISLDKEMNNGH